MTDYTNMYLKLFRASEEAINILIAAQQGCEELYINRPEADLQVLSLPSEAVKHMDGN